MENPEKNNNKDAQAANKSTSPKLDESAKHNLKKSDDSDYTPEEERFADGKGTLLDKEFPSKKEK